MTKRLLLVDDEPRNLALLEATLRPLQHEIVCVGDGRAALALFERTPPDLMLLDLTMPGFDGFDVLAHIRSRHDPSPVPIILMTAEGERERRLLGLRAGANDFLEKPIDGLLLLARVATLLHLKESRDELAAVHDELLLRHQALEQLQQSQKELTEFLVHDLKTPLFVVHSNVEWLRSQLPADQTELLDALDDAREATRRLGGMVDDLLTVARIEQADFPLSRDLISVRNFFRTIGLPYQERALQRRLSFSTSVDEELRIEADPNLLQRVLENLLDNSLRHTPKWGRVALEARANGTIEITVSNTSPPIPPGEREHIFEKFVRGDARDRHGTGLGLYFCKRAIEAHGGQIEVIETPDWPVSFRVQLPALV